MNGSLLKRIIQSYYKHDDKEFLASIRQIISAERKIGHEKLADDLTKLIPDISESIQLNPSTPINGNNVTILSKKDNTPLIDIWNPDKNIRDIILYEDTQLQINRFLEEYSKSNLLSSYGLKPKLKLLFYGPPGNGKTLCAQILASELSLPLFYVRFDSLVSSYLGETASNLRRVFDYASSHSGVLLFDEFDAIGKSRDDKEDVGELKRVVNSFLQLLDNYSGDSPIIAATNYEKSLDYALWRRFDSLVYFPQANTSQIEKYLELRLSSIPNTECDVKSAALLCDGLSFADVSRAFTEAIKTMVLTDSKKLNFSMFKSEIELYRVAQTIRSSRTDQ